MDNEISRLFAYINEDSMLKEISRLKEYNNELLETLAQVLKDQQELREKYDQLQGETWHTQK